MRVLNCFYDMAVSPCSYDFYTFAYSAEICRLRRGLDAIKMIFVQGPRDYFRDDNIRTTDQNKNFFLNVIVPGISTVPSCVSFVWINRSEINIENTDPVYIFPRGYSPQAPTAEYVAHELVSARIRGDQVSSLRAPTFASELALSFIRALPGDKPVITITTREIERDDPNAIRRLNTSAWQEVISKLKHRYHFIIIRDTDAAHTDPMFVDAIECPQASINVSMRLALYEQSHINFTKNTGPALLMLYGNTKCFYFAQFDEDIPAVSEQWFLSHFGMTPGGQYPMTTTSHNFIWSPDDADTIYKLINDSLSIEEECTELAEINDGKNIIPSINVGLRHLIFCLRFNILAEDFDLYRSIKSHFKTPNDKQGLESAVLKAASDSSHAQRIRTLISAVK